MHNVAVDLDGTISAFPRQFKEIMRALKIAGNKVVILTGADNPYNGDKEVRRAQIASLGIDESDIDELLICRGQDWKEVAEIKGDYCRDNKVDFVFEDSDEFISAIKRKSPSTACVRITNV